MIKLFLNCLIEQNYKYSKNPQKHAATNKVKFTMSDRQPSVSRGAVQCLCLVAVSYSLPPPGLQPTRLLCPWGFFRLEYWSELPCPPPGIKPRSLPCMQILYCLGNQGSHGVELVLDYIASVAP